MTGLELFFIGLIVAAFAATTWVAGVVLWRLLKSPRR